MNEIVIKYQRTHFDMNKEVLPMRVLNGKYHKEFQHNIGVRQWLIVAGIFYLAYAVSSLSRFSDALL